MRETLCVTLIFAILIAGCAGHEPRIIPAYIPGDEKKSCMVLKAEMAQIQAEIQKKQKKHEEKGFWNVFLFIGGLLVIVPFFFMDIKGAEEAESEALQTRCDRLSILAAEKDCDLTGLGSTEETPAESKEDTADVTK